MPLTLRHNLHQIHRKPLVNFLIQDPKIKLLVEYLPDLHDFVEEK